VHVLRHHVVRNVSSTVLPAVTLQIPTVVFVEAGLAFLDLSDPELLSWGNAVAQGITHFNTRWWVATVPLVVLVVTLLAFDVLGDTLRDVLDPWLERPVGVRAKEWAGGRESALPVSEVDAVVVVAVDVVAPQFVLVVVVVPAEHVLDLVRQVVVVIVVVAHVSAPPVVVVDRADGPETVVLCGVHRFADVVVLEVP
jgi:hypothetical protein